MEFGSTSTVGPSGSCSYESVRTELAISFGIGVSRYFPRFA
jgi:hypothetical protein